MITHLLKAGAILIFASTTISAKDLFLTDGRILRAITVKETSAKQLRVSHDSGIAVVDTGFLTRADYYELGVHKKVSTPLPALAAIPPRTQSQETSPSTRSYGSKQFASRDYSSRPLGFAGSMNPEPTSESSSSSTGPSYSGSSYRVPDYKPSTYTGSSSGGTVSVRGYYRKNGTYVRPYTRRR